MRKYLLVVDLIDAKIKLVIKQAPQWFNCWCSKKHSAPSPVAQLTPTCLEIWKLVRCDLSPNWCPGKVATFIIKTWQPCGPTQLQWKQQRNPRTWKNKSSTTECFNQKILQTILDYSCPFSCHRQFHRNESLWQHQNAATHLDETKLSKWVCLKMLG